jgi:hypothetical protein
MQSTDLTLPFIRFSGAERLSNMRRRIPLKARAFVGLSLVLFFLAAVDPTMLIAQSLPLAEKQKIETLIKQVGDLKDATFVRNGSSYRADNAVTFLRLKWQANDARVKTARDFIDKVASFSGTSGRPYLIRFKDGKEIKSQDFFLAELKRIET